MVFQYSIHVIFMITSRKGDGILELHPQTKIKANLSRPLPTLA
jgi:hypothetical protein